MCALPVSAYSLYVSACPLYTFGQIGLSKRPDFFHPDTNERNQAKIAGLYIIRLIYGVGLMTIIPAAGALYRTAQVFNPWAEHRVQHLKLAGIDLATFIVGTGLLYLAFKASLFVGDFFFRQFGQMLGQMFEVSFIDSVVAFMSQMPKLMISSAIVGLGIAPPVVFANISRSLQPTRILIILL